MLVTLFLPISMPISSMGNRQASGVILFNQQKSDHYSLRFKPLASSILDTSISYT